MSAIFNKIKAEWLEARKGRLELKSSVLNTVVSDISLIGKNEARETTDEDCIAVVKKHLKGVDETIRIINNGTPSTRSMESLVFERDVLTAVLPSQLGPDETRKIIEQNQITTIKDAMAFFKHHYAGRFDGKLVSGYFR